ncbi:MAG: enoyl-[acyl-carrier-protein] reductase FabK [Bacillota bacterium]|uniref:Probable nitronate monooxygenase n=2 Tax=Carboxydocella TaxID=178898 RepID=A0A1T4NVY3_9FIRM|nr:MULTISPECIES: enoyl-[acyl-carrier-protein] reductase FabK [Carboxydocella]AVX20176.1 enoyl-[acyl-carrier protein] reductase II [Carboxydocella thermautotrophica]GAW28409.1 2-nitropropane dioxygenase [Carboxydocella sp. ULO1]GAW30838.1 2-nitropropane dioxygenase [Carboxydocella sp. JDF658]SJZ82908.1 enoyl-[acyl-carrier protein] reductase II [Carboxydocella sporoproducens DSM 16521]
MLFKTPLCDLLGIEYPIFQGGMAWVATAELAAAVSEAGGLGIIGSGHAPAEWVQDQIRQVKERTSKPFGVNVMLMSPHVKEVMEVIVREKVAVVTTGAGNPGVYMPALREAGIRVIPVVASVALAQRLERQGVDAIIAEGTESGGHVGELTTMALVPQVVDAVRVPVIAAGGIADGRQFLAALALGAVGVQMGTRFMCASECTIHPAVKEQILKAKDRDTVVTGRSTGHPVRVIKNKLARQFEEMEKRCAPPEEIEKLGVGKMRAAMIDGDVEYGSLMAGQVAAMVKKIQPAAEIIREIVQEAEAVHSRLRGLGG